MKPSAPLRVVNWRLGGWEARHTPQCQPDLLPDLTLVARHALDNDVPEGKKVEVLRVLQDVARSWRGEIPHKMLHLGGQCKIVEHAPEALNSVLVEVEARDFA